MASFAHDGPLDLLRKRPRQVAAMLRETLGLELPRFATASPTDSNFTQIRPAAFYADLTITLHGGGRDRRPVMGIIIELQLNRDGRKRRSWPLYAAALHARLRCQTCLVVIAPRAGVARWAATPIETMQPGSPFRPLVVGPEQIPRVSIGRAHRQPWMAVLSALAHGNSPGGVSIALAAIDAVSSLPDEHAMVCFDRIRESLDEAAGRALEHEMHYGRYEFKSEFARRYFGAGIEKGRKEGHKEGLREGHERGLKRGLHEGLERGLHEGLERGLHEGLERGLHEGLERGLHEGLEAMRAALLVVAEQRFGLAVGKLRQQLEACDDLGRLTDLLTKVSTAPDRGTVERLVAGLGRTPARRATRATRGARTAEGRATRTARARRARAARR
jgi:hypothetical protein